MPAIQKVSRREKLIAKLTQQKALLDNPILTETVLRRVKDADGAKRTIEVVKPIRPWWREDALGTIYFAVRYGARPIELEKGKAAVLVPSRKELPAVVDTLMSAINAGELDEILSQQAKVRMPPKAKRAV